MAPIPSELFPSRRPGRRLRPCLSPEVGGQDGVSTDSLVFRNHERTLASTAARLPQANARHTDDPLLVGEPGKKVHQTPIRPIQAHGERRFDIKISLSFGLRDEGANV